MTFILICNLHAPTLHTQFIFYLLIPTLNPSRSWQQKSWAKSCSSVQTHCLTQMDILVIVESLVVTVLGGKVLETFRTSRSVWVRSDIWLVL